MIANLVKTSRNKAMVQYARLQFGDLPSRHCRGHPALSKELVPPACVGGIFTGDIPQIQELAINQRDQL